MAAEPSEVVRCRLRGLRTETLPWTDAPGENIFRLKSGGYVEHAITTFCKLQRWVLIIPPKIETMRARSSGTFRVDRRSSVTFTTGVGTS